jgi:hypothetical protein
VGRVTTLPHVIVAGYAQLPQSTGAGVLYRHLTIVAKVDRRTHAVVDVSTTLTTKLADDFVREQLIGRVVTEDGDAFGRTVEANYLGNGQKAIIGAYKDLCRRYVLDGETTSGVRPG